MPEVENLYSQGKLPEMMCHWYEIRKQYPEEDHIIAYRMGDFYEMFYDDAKKVSKLLGLTLTQRGKGETAHPLAGIPHRATQHFKSLIMQGITVVVVEQLEDPKLATGKIVKRGVVKILSPGTVIDEDLLDSHRSNFLCAIYKDKKLSFGIALVELSSAEFYCREFTVKLDKEPLEMLLSFISNYKPVECLLPVDLFKDVDFIEALKQASNMIFKQIPAFPYSYQNAFSLLCKQFKAQNLDGFGLKDKECAVSAAGAILFFLQETQKTTIDNITRIKYVYEKEFMIIDANTQRNLELVSNMSNGGSFGSLLSIIDRTQTPMGSRKLKTLIVQPLTDINQLKARLDAVEWLFNNPFERNELRTLLSAVGDLNRIISRINFVTSANARDLVHLKNALMVVPKIQALLKGSDNPLLKFYGNTIQPVDDLVHLIQRAIVDSPPISVMEGEIIKPGYNQKVDEYREIIKNGNTWFDQYEESLKNQFQIKTGLKIQFNQVLGYFIQVTNNIHKQIENIIPDDWETKQTVSNGVRFTTKTLKEMEVKILEADSSIKDLEYSIFQQIRKETAKYTEIIKTNAETLSMVDILTSFAEVSFQLNYHKPEVDEGNEIIIINGRHPVIEIINKSEPFVPNSLTLNNTDHQVLIITGPNWSGKSTYLRQNALIVLMAQLGCFVPADEAKIGIVDRIFTRIGASDDLTRGQSTFLMEMNETANILNYASEKSLVIVDELGRGTSTTDGLAIARAVLEKLHDKGIKTLFSTHFHELVELKLPRVSNYHFKILEQGHKLIFLREITKGGTDKSYGIHVALMAGLAKDVIDKAFQYVNLYSGEQIYCINESENTSKKEQKESEPKGKESKAAFEKSEQKSKESKAAFEESELELEDEYDHVEITQLQQKLSQTRHEMKRMEDSILKLKHEIEEYEKQKAEEKQAVENLIVQKQKTLQELKNLDESIAMLNKEKEKLKMTQETVSKPKPEKPASKTIQSFLVVPDTPKNKEGTPLLYEDIVNELKSLDLNLLTPLDAFMVLNTLKKKIK